MKRLSINSLALTGAAGMVLTNSGNTNKRRCGEQDVKTILVNLLRLEQTPGIGNWTYGNTAWPGTCSSGQSQSPIDVRTSDFVSGKPTFRVNYEDSVRISGYTHPEFDRVFKMDKAPCGKKVKLDIGLDDFELLQVHFHSPSEHTVDGQTFPMEMQMLFKAAGSSKLAAVGVVFQQAETPDKENLFLQQFWELTSSTSEGEKEYDVDFRLFKLPKRYARYTGSLTTPPCDEDVEWTVFVDPMEASKKQLESMTNLIAVASSGTLTNNRPVQPLNNREVMRGGFEADFGTQDDEAVWNYDNIDSWGTELKHTTCSTGLMQSPINIQYSSSQGGPIATLNDGFKPTLNGPLTMRPSFAKKHGHAFKLTLASGEMSVDLGDSNGPYRLLQFHFHRSSEHTLNSIRFPMEMHAVFEGQNKQLAIFGVLFKADPNVENEFLNQFWGMADAGALDAADNSTQVNVDFGSLFGQLSDQKYVRYVGSLSTPPCTENVLWTVFTSPLVCSPAQLAKLKALMANRGVPKNFRTIQGDSSKRASVQFGQFKTGSVSSTGASSTLGTTGPGTTAVAPVDPTAALQQLAAATQESVRIQAATSLQTQLLVKRLIESVTTTLSNVMQTQPR